MFTSTFLLALAATTTTTVSAVPCNKTTGSSSSSSSPQTSGVLNNSNTTSSGAVVKCPVVLDGRIPASTALTDLDTANGIFNPDYVKGNNLSWSDILLFPEVAHPSRFDDGGGDGAFKALEVTIDDASVFQQQTGFRRAGLQFAADANENSTGWAGTRTLHWSVRQDAARALNLSHEYLNVWHEAADYSADQVMFQAGRMIDQPGLAADTFKLFDRDATLLWETPIDFAEWQNFAITLDVDANTVQIYYSLGSAALEAVTGVVSADLSGMGQFQLGILKKPTGTSDVATSGYQESPLDEGLIYGGLFVEDSTGGCVSL